MITKEPRNVLIEVDVQNDFISGSLAVTEGEQVVQPLNDIATLVRSSGGDVVQTRDWHPATTPHFDVWPVHCVADTDGAAFHPNLEIEATDITISKGMGQTHGYSGVEGVSETGTTLVEIIQPKDQTERVRVLMGGLATDYCVKATALDLAKHFENDEQVEVVLIRDAIRAVNLQANDEANALKALEEAKVLAMTAGEIKEQFFAKEGFAL